MIEQAKAKIKGEMEKENNPYVEMIGEFLTNYISENEAEAEKIVADEKKTIMGSLEEMKKEASKNKVEGMAMLTPKQGFEVVLKYYGIKKPEKGLGIDYSLANEKEVETKNSDFNVKLDDFL